FYFLSYIYSLFFFFITSASTPIFPLSLHDALPICSRLSAFGSRLSALGSGPLVPGFWRSGIPGSVGRSRVTQCSSIFRGDAPQRDRKSTRLNSSHRTISYAVFCLKKKKKHDKKRNI